MREGVATLVRVYMCAHTILIMLLLPAIQLTRPAHPIWSVSWLTVHVGLWTAEILGDPF